MTLFSSCLQRQWRIGRVTVAFPSLLVCALFVAAISGRAETRPVYGDDRHDGDRKDQREVVLGVTHLNADCYADTLVATVEFGDELRYIPRFIVWGRPSASDSLGLEKCSDDISRKKKYHRTPIKLPNWKSLRTSVAFEHINADTLVDIVIHVRGEEENKGKLKKTMRSLVMFGQRGTDTLSTLDFGTMEKFQSRPFFAMELRKGVDLTEPAQRDLSGKTSWILLPPEIDMPEAPAPQAASVETPAPPHSVNIYPNPAGTSVTVEMGGLARGEYLLELMAVNGTLEQRRETVAGDGGHIAETLDLEQTPSGYYVVRVLRGGIVVGSYAVVVKK